MSSTENSTHASGLLQARPQTIAKPPSGAAGLQPLRIDEGRDGALFVPDRRDASQPAPLIVALHGAGGVASQVTRLLAEPAETYGIILLAPESRERTWDVIRGGYGPDVSFIDLALNKVFRSHAIDPERIAVAGFSDGASYALSLGLMNALFSDILAFSPGFMAPTQMAGKPRIFISHGIGDEVLPIDRCSRRLLPSLRRQGYDVDYAEFDGGHVVPEEMVERAVRRFLKMMPPDPHSR